VRVRLLLSSATFYLSFNLPSFLPSSFNLPTIPSNSKAKDYGSRGVQRDYRQTRLADFDDPHAVATFERALLSRAGSLELDIPLVR